MYWGRYSSNSTLLKLSSQENLFTAGKQHLRRQRLFFSVHFIWRSAFNFNVSTSSTEDVSVRNHIYLLLKRFFCGFEFNVEDRGPTSNQ